ncbi:DadA Glycine/D-amino acid oxidases (deaminating) [Caulobacteraceae bacterium]
MTTPASRLPPEPEISFDDRGLILGDAFHDSYFSRDNGLEETRIVFLKGCGLPEAWRSQSHFTVAELGFGTGLNVLATWDLWRNTRQPGQILHFITTEAFLMAADHAAKAHAHWPELADLSGQLLARWPVRAFGNQRIWFEDDGFCLTILVGPALPSLQAMDFKADAWFLDGFAPSRNAEMWSPELLQEVARLCAPGARLATYSVAGAVRRGLEACGFTVSRQPGFGSKRQRLEAVWPGKRENAPAKPASVLIIGGGIAGAAVSFAFARRGVRVELLDGDPCGQSKASHNPAALVMPRLDRGDTREARFFRAAYLCATSLYAGVGREMFAQTQVQELPGDDRDRMRLGDLGQNPPLPPELLGRIDNCGLLHRTGGLVYPDLLLPRLSQNAIRHPVTAAALHYQSGQWQALNEAGDIVAEAEVCVIASGTQLDRFVKLDTELEGRAGQISLAQIDGALPETAVAGGPYAATFHTQLLFGATFDPWDLGRSDKPGVLASGHQQNRDSLSSIAPELSARINLATAFGRSSVRVAAKDRLPIAGAALPKASQEGPGFFVMGALGSRGFTTAHWLAEHVASLACGEPSPLERGVAAAVSPKRFEERRHRGQTPRQL